MIELFEYKSELTLRVYQEELQKAKRWALERNPDETGGILLGHYLEEGDLVVIEQFIHLPDADASQSHYQRPGLKNDQIAEFADSNSESYYVGEWHTHPDSIPAPSAVDLIAMMSLLAGNSLPVELPVQIIIGMSSDNCCWAGYLADASGYYPFSFPKI